MQKSLAASLCLAMTLLIGCGRSEVKSNGEVKTQLMLDWVPEPEFGGFYAAQNGTFAKHGLDVEIQTAGAGVDTWPLVATGKMDFATTAADQVLLARSKGADVVAIFAVYQTSPQGVMVHKARGFTKLADVFNHDGILAAQDDAWLQFCRNKFPDAKVKLINYSGGVAEFLAQSDYSQQCFITSEPRVAAGKGGDPQTLLIADEGYNPYVTVVITRGQLLKDHPDQVKAMVEACREGWRAYLDDPRGADAIMAQLNKDMDLPTFAAVAEAQKPLIETAETRANGLGTMTKQRWQTLEGQWVDLKKFGNTPPPAVEECFVNLP